MKVAFIHRGFESLGVEYLSACLKKAGHETFLVFDPNLFGSYQWNNNRLNKIFDYQAILIKELDKINPDIVAFSVVSNDYLWACSLGSQIKESRDIPIVFGGVHPTAVPDEVIQQSFVDYVCVGEAEEAFVDLINFLQKGISTVDIPNVWAKKSGKVYQNKVRDLVYNLDDLPFPDKKFFSSIYPGFAKEIYKIQASRGCIFSCAYCNMSSFCQVYGKAGNHVRHRSVDNVLKELKHALETQNIKRVVFLDNIFTSDEDWLNEFSIKFKKEINIPFACHVHPLTINENIIDKLLYAGCITLSMGIQSVNEGVRKNIFFRSETNSRIKKSIKLIKSKKIFLYLDIIFGIPEQNDIDMMEIAEFFSKGYFPDELISSWINYYPNTQIVDLAYEMGLLQKNDLTNIKKGEKYFFPNQSGIGFKKNIAKMFNCIKIFRMMPNSFVQEMIKRKGYYLIPASFGMSLMHISSRLYKKLFDGKSGDFYYRGADLFRFYSYFMLKIFCKNFKVTK